MNDTIRLSPARVCGVVALVSVVLGIVAVAFRGSWGAFRDAALASHFDRASADLYPFAVDGLMVVAIIALVLLRHDRGARWYCLGIIGGYTGASLLINFLHGLGMFAIDRATGTRPVPPWPVVVVIASLVVGSIFLGSHLLVYVWRHVFPEPHATRQAAGPYRRGTHGDEDGTGVPELPPSNVDTAKIAYRQSLAPAYKTLSQQDLMDRYGISKRQAARIQNEVKAELDANVDEPPASGSESATEQDSPNGRAHARTAGDPS
jgi:uncharacterized protein DUF2637